jgi:hypothetical protein
VSADELPSVTWRRFNEGVAVDPARPGAEFTYLVAFPGVPFNRHAARGWNELRRTSRVTLAQWAFIVRNTRHIRNDNERHAARTEAMIILRVGGRWVPK